ncbi:FKBP-type peptidyl-prolyl cis-trans isomerase [Prevotella sp. E2-28]|uniref:FKBP-type peptidyl-prolyl cis-trans isomerase n=1 Tax=Prevotella sp. E2-28 TaxID=2913620 RepID=UPI001EDB8940|nr:FKBP-type peptidyl-prolyl cis-trans isomerase [Prevotella sp. E2-28]UKK53277.1 FKBP-type peptidyl-prolyl cis-trans isomerase [Prevotella sp. E2-28]
MVKGWVKVLPFYLFTLLPLFTSCSEEASEEEEFANWKERNDLYLTALAEDSMQQAGWQRFKKYSLDQNEEGAVSDYVYVKQIEKGEGTESPLFTDSVRVVYQGRLIPSKSYSKGFVFDGTVYGTYSSKTAYTSRQKVSGLIAGYTTALMHMHKGDYWRIYIPYELGYGESGSGTKVPGYSVLIFDLTLLDISPIGEVMKPWR